MPVLTELAEIMDPHLWGSRMGQRADTTLNFFRDWLAETAHKAGGAFAALVTHSPRYAAVEALNLTSDAELASKGLTRAQVAEQLFRHDG